jgi:hypothetical protein
MRRKIIGMLLGIVGWLAVPLASLHAATIDETINQVNAYEASGEIRDAQLADSLRHMLSDAKYYGNAGDTASRDNYLEAFRDTVNANSGDLITAAAATTLVGMAQ